MFLIWWPFLNLKPILIHTLALDRPRDEWTVVEVEKVIQIISVLESNKLHCMLHKTLHTL